jgi:hypothetical protein
MILHFALFIKRRERIVPMASILLAVIYLAFISMGLPDALLGSAWPSIYGRMNVPVSFAGIITS